ncbi:MAG: hypothetical protein EHM41_07630 [Chloroflexi bacterium]|nr:MAG: hypothetical protein EHM41_07630 [Chloroflexota bacterium]
MELINRYIAEVGRHLPEKTRIDIEQEIRSLLEDRLEDHSRKTGKPVDEDMVVEVLKEYSPPPKLAAAYQPERFLIGPKTFPAFMTVVKIVLPIILILAALGFGLQLGRTELDSQDIVSTFTEGISGMIDSIFSALGIIVLVFAILERTLPEFKSKSLDSVVEGEWDPRKLPKPAPSPEKVKFAGLSIEIAITVIALTLFNFYPEIIAVSTRFAGEWRSAPLLSDIFYERYLPWLSLIWGVQIILNVVLISRGRWEPVTTWIYLAVKTATIMLALVILAGPSITALTASDLASFGSLALEQAELIVNIIRQVVRWALIIAVIASGVDIISTAWKQLFKKSSVNVLTTS